jgi:deazaflavin-dependent oxidoreductase (nitroreductase family)
MTAEDPVELSFDALNAVTHEVHAGAGPGTSRWVADGSLTQRTNAALIAAHRAHGGRVPGELEDVPFLLLTTTGARTGQPRTVPLWASEVEGRLLVVASMGGADRNPPWFHNAVAHPDVIVEWQGDRFPARAAVLEGDERDRLFAILATRLPNFGDYQERTDRVLPVVELVRSG